MLWGHRNSCVFEGSSPSLSVLLRLLADEHHLWCLAGAKGLRALDVAQIVRAG
ncbi:hypothetical protein PR202_gb20679 [Eleusine coracana subsp. coracana]|uniref:Uncharacterized protein n=1 Tax=Eleusine coracana subsp. coracana TaxID=191504 RepID=A0AAV5FBA7_ELECO|nr:hypothetical protein PR202_gb20679 [Eleusine coracana subsp. coracana]